MSQFNIIKLVYTGEIAGVNMPPPPEMPMGCQGGAWAGELSGTSPLNRQSQNERRFKLAPTSWKVANHLRNWPLFLRGVIRLRELSASYDRSVPGASCP